jgi:AraC-like DNA-binding protein
VDTSCIRQARFDDFEAFAASLPGASLAATPLRPGPFSSAVVELRLGEVVLQVGRTTAVTGLGGVAPDSAWILLPLGAAGAFRLEGQAVGPGEVGIYGPGAEHEGAVPHDSTRWALVTLPATAAEALLEPPRHSPLRRRGGHAVLRANPRAWARAASLVRTAAQVAADEPAVFGVAEARRGLRDELLEAMRELLDGPHGGARPRALPATPARRRTVRAVEDLLRADPCRAMSTEEVCIALGVPPSRLQAAIEASFAVSPDHYLRLRRLTLARAALRSAEARWASVEQVAAAHGFWDAAVFRREYRDAFGEAPSLAFRRGAE